MPMLTHRFEQPLHWAQRQSGLSKMRRARLERLALHALTVLSMGSVLTALIALRAAIYFWHLGD
ncbi:hypothetical protein GGD65_001796 [Bradyrhizobium sp. CIR18]|uniref:hypothetical protein n=1 Tax=unclassified Bradyrhizobium TaxID=2631580 RepID=UPI00037EB30B|nr:MULTISPECIES: hypothetical protein [unclassified Bradyrhizobium]MBB4360774.1 hypothetical protein [Bradyrhizobium sp. CIR18]